MGRPTRSPRASVRANVEYNARTLAAILLAMIGMVGSAVCLTSAAGSWDASHTMAVALTIAGALVSILHPVGVTMVLRDRDANVVFATIGGPGIVATHVALAVVFGHPLGWWQWLAIVGITMGLVLLRTEAPGTSTPSEQPE